MHPRYGTAGVTLPVVVPPLWGTYPDTQAKAAEQARRVEVAEAAMAAATGTVAGGVFGGRWGEDGGGELP